MPNPRVPALVLAALLCAAAAAHAAELAFADLNPQEQLEFANALEQKGRDLRRALVDRDRDLRRAADNQLGDAFLDAIRAAHSAAIAAVAAREVTHAAVRASTESQAALAQEN